jgi:hypothetical protein
MSQEVLMDPNDRSNPGINWRTVAEQALGTLIASGIIAAASWIVSLVRQDHAPGSSLLLGAAALLALVVASLLLAPLRRTLISFGRWLLARWLLVVAAAIALALALASYFILSSIIAAVLVCVAAAGAALLTASYSRRLRTLEPAPSVPDSHPSPEIPPPSFDTKLVRFVPPFRPGQYSIVRLPDSSPPQQYNFPLAPLGLSVFYGVPFFLWPSTDTATGALLGHRTVSVQPSETNDPVIRVIAVHVGRVAKAHLLITAGHGWREKDGEVFLHRRIGFVHLDFADHSRQTVEIVLGRNVREWAFGNDVNLVEEIDTSQTVPAWLAHNSTRRLDMMSVVVLGGPREVRTITLEGRFENDHPGRVFPTPAIIVSAITCESSA